MLSYRKTFSFVFHLAKKQIFNHSSKFGGHAPWLLSMLTAST